MTIKSQIDIDINDKDFQAFKKLFDDYRNVLEKTPETWKKIGQASSATKTNFESIADGMKVVGSTIAGITKSGTEFFQVTTATARHWHNLAISTASVAKNIVGATESLLKWSGIISLVTGGAGLFGFDRLAQSVSSQRMAAMGTGGAYGARAAFVTNFRRFGDPESLLGRVSEAQTSFKESVSLRLLGLTQEDLKGDPADVAIKALQHGAQIASHDKATGLPVGSDPHLQLFTTAERIRLRDHPEEIEEMVARMRADQKSGRLNLSPADQKGYQDFTTRMEKASREIETIFVKGLVKLAGPLGELSDATVKLVDKFTDKALPAFISDLAGAVDWLAKEVEKPSFVEKVEGIVAMIGSLASAFGGMLSGLGGFARWLGVAPAQSSAFAGGATPGSGGGGTTGKGFGTHGAEGSVTTGPASDRGGTASAGESAEVVAFIRQEAITRGIDPDVAVAVARSEGLIGFDPSKGHWSTGSNDAGTSFTPYQLHYASNIPGFRARGLGDDFTRDTGLDARKMENWKAATDYALDTAARKHSWRDWHGFNRHPSGEGLSHAHSARQSVTISATPGGNTSLGSAAVAAGSP